MLQQFAEKFLLLILTLSKLTMSTFPDVYETVDNITSTGIQYFFFSEGFPYSTWHYSSILHSLWRRNDDGPGKW